MEMMPFGTYPMGHNLFNLTLTIMTRLDKGVSPLLLAINKAAIREGGEKSGAKSNCKSLDIILAKFKVL